LADLSQHFQQRELADRNPRISYSTKKAYAGYLEKWIDPRWGEYRLLDVRAVEVESWLKSLNRAPGTRSKIRNVMSLLFNHGRRHELCDHNPIQWVRQSAKRRTAPDVLTSSEVQSLLASLCGKERTLVLLAVTTGLRRSELFALKWKDVDFHTKQIYVTRSIVQNVVGICKTESSQKPVPAHHDLVEALREWHGQTPYQSPESWVFASPVNQGRWPYLAQQVMRRHILPVARRLGITKQIGWHTFRHTYSTLLRSTGAELKIIQELLRHSTIRVTLDTYTQAVTTEKRNAQEAVVALLFREKTQET
jgi:integrase